MAFALTAPVSYPLVLTVVGWVGCLFCGFGLTSRGTATSLIALAVGSIAVATAVLLILDLSNPYSGVFRASSALIGFSNSMFTASECPTKTGTRTQVATTLILGSRIFLVSATIFHSSLV